MARRKKEPNAAHLAVEGPLGAGKAVFAEAWARRRGSRRVRIDPEANPFLAEALEAPERRAFSAQMYFLLARQRQEEALRQGELFAGEASAAGVVSEGVFERDRVFADVFLSEPERALYDRIYRVLAERVAVPDLVVWLSPHPDAAFERVRLRSRRYERSLGTGRVGQLVRGFSELRAAWTRSPVLDVRLGTTDLGEEDAALARVLAEAERMGSERLDPGDHRILDLSGPPAA